MTAIPPGRWDWSDHRVLVTGGAGFIGSSVTEALRRRGVSPENLVVPRSSYCDLRFVDQCARAVDGCDVVLHLAAPTGGIAFSRTFPASQYHDSMLINLNLLEAARQSGVRRFLGVGNLLAYPATAPSPLREDTLHDGPVASTHLGIGLVKRDMVSLAEMYRLEHGLHVTNVLCANVYGPRDRFDPRHSHVIPATILKCFRDEDLVVWGDGTPTRDFIYVDDAAVGILLAAERLEAGQYTNLASGSEISIASLVELIARISGFAGRIVFDDSKASSDPRRVASTVRCRELLGFRAGVGIEEGLRRTIEWYRAHRAQGVGTQ
jgi:GDP-L-fucose synthase